jgi:beta-galactosidase
LSYVRVGEGAWWYFEPEEKQFRFDLFDRVVAECEKRKLRVIFGTPTYCGPAWVATRYPEVLRWNFNRVPMQHGSRRFYNYTSEAYFELSDRIVTALAEHYRGAAPIFAWQVDNEFNCHMDTSYAPSDTRAFRAWLREKYGTLDKLNDAWGTRFWSQVYSDWDQLDLPHPTATYHNPTQLLDEARFVSDCVVRYARRQVAILKRVQPRWITTHNGIFPNVDAPALAKEFDVFGHDSYPRFFERADAVFKLAETRGLSFPFYLLEQQAGPGGQMSYLHRTPRPGEMRMWTYQSIAHGASKLSYFCWRTCPFGSEQHWHGLVDADGVVDNRRVREAKQAATELRSLPAEFVNAPVEKVIALHRDYDNEFNDWKINSYVKSRDLRAFANACAEAHVPVDHVWSGAALDGYKVLVALHAKIVDDATVAWLTAFARGGGTLVLGAESGTMDRNCHMRQATPPGPLSALAGITVEDWSTCDENESHAAKWGDAELRMVKFVERLRPTTAKALATWAGGDLLLGDAPAVTINRVGKGRVVYVGGYLDRDGCAALLTKLCEIAGVAPLVDAPADVQAVARVGEKSRYLVLLNTAGQDRVVRGVPAGDDLLASRRVGGEMTLPPFGVAVVRSER